MYMTKRILIGTSGWRFRSSEKEFYPVGMPSAKKLNFYAEQFPTVEVNSSFYHFPRETSYAAWKESVGKDFVIALKVNKVITHEKRFQAVSDDWQRFLQGAELLGHRLGPFLFQLPASFKVTSDTRKHLRKFIQTELRPLVVKGYRFAFEFRHDSWFCDTRLQKFFTAENIALVLADSSRYPTATVQTADFAYIRMHGPEKLFMSSYSDEQLKALAERIQKMTGDVYVYFNNDGSNLARENAWTLQRFL